VVRRPHAGQSGLLVRQSDIAAEEPSETDLGAVGGDAENPTPRNTLAQVDGAAKVDSGEREPSAENEGKPAL
jgi:hypothetical protein